MRSSKLYLYNCGMVSLLSLALFAGNCQFTKEQGHVLIVLDGWIKFYCSFEVCSLLHGVWERPDAMLKRCVDAPKAEDSEDAAVERQFLDRLDCVLGNEQIC